MSMRTLAVSTSVLALSLVITQSWPSAQQNQAFLSGTTGPSPYDVVRGWHKPFAGPGFAFGGNSGVFAESPNRIFVAQRGEARLPDPVPPAFSGLRRIDRHQRAERHRPPRLAELPLHARRQRQRQGTMDAVGLALRGIGRAGTASDPHQPVRSRTSRVGRQRNVQPDLRVLERRQQAAEDARREERAGNDGTHFGKPQDVAFLPDGRILVADGLDNHRVMILDRDVNYSRRVRRQRQGPGSVQRRPRRRGRTRRPHLRPRSIGRPHQRLQDDVRSREGRLRRSVDRLLRSRSTSSSTTTAVWVTDLDAAALHQARLQGQPPLHVDGAAGSAGRLPRGAHVHASTRAGNLYGGDNQYGRTQKFVPKPGADPALIIRPPWRAK